MCCRLGALVNVLLTNVDLEASSTRPQKAWSPTKLPMKYPKISSVICLVFVGLITGRFSDSCYFYRFL